MPRANKLDHKTNTKDGGSRLLDFRVSIFFGSLSGFFFRWSVVSELALWSVATFRGDQLS